jgi:hypothetical protein
LRTTWRQLESDGAVTYQNRHLQFNERKLNASLKKLWQQSPSVFGPGGRALRLQGLVDEEGYTTCPWEDNAKRDCTALKLLLEMAGNFPKRLLGNLFSPSPDQCLKALEKLADLWEALPATGMSSYFYKGVLDMLIKSSPNKKARPSSAAYARAWPWDLGGTKACFEFMCPGLTPDAQNLKDFMCLAYRGLLVVIYTFVLMFFL